MAECMARIPTPEVFYDLRHRTIYEMFVEITEDQIPIDTIIAGTRLKSMMQLDAVGGWAYLASLPDNVPSAANLGFYLNVVLEKYQLRRMISVCTNAMAQIYEHEGDVEELLDGFEAEALKVRVDMKNNVITGPKDTVREVIGDFDAMVNNPGAITGISTGFPDLDKMTMGMQNGEMIVIAGRPSIGKSSIAMNIAEHIGIDQKIPVGVFSLEMSKKSLIARIITSRARVNIRNLQDGFLADRDLPKITGSAGKVATAPIYIDDSSTLTIQQLKARARRMFVQFGIKIFLIDFLQRVQPSRFRESRQQEVSEISNGCKELAAELQVPVIVLTQLNRAIEKDKKRKPNLSDLRESGAIEQDADLVGLLYKPNISDEDIDGQESDAIPVNLLIAKQRNGPTGDVHLTFLKCYTRYESAAKISGDDVPGE